MVQGPNSYAGLDLDARQGGMSFTTCKNLVYQPATRRPPRLGRPILAQPPILTTVTTFRRSSKGEDSSLLFKTERVSLKNRSRGRETLSITSFPKNEVMEPEQILEMDQPISLRILRIILVMTHGYKKCCNVSQIIYRRLHKVVDRFQQKYRDD
ncbi:hypothetical protein YC2023_022441 [Brassica napus]